MAAWFDRTKTSFWRSRIWRHRNTNFHFFSDFQSHCQLPPDVFTVAWPVGTSITNELEQKGSVVTAVDGEGLQALFQLRKSKTKTPEPPNPLGSKDAQSTTGNKTVKE